MRPSILTGMSFGVTSGIITTLGLIVGLHSGTHSRLAVMGGVLTIAIADAFSDALGIHISEESEGKHDRAVWESTFSTFLSKFVLALSFLAPILFLDLETAIWVSVAFGMLLLGLLSYFIASGKTAREKRNVVLEHLTIAVVVVFLTHFVGDGISILFG